MNKKKRIVNMGMDNILVDSLQASPVSAPARHLRTDGSDARGDRRVAQSVLEE